MFNSNFVFTFLSRWSHLFIFSATLGLAALVPVSLVGAPETNSAKLLQTTDPADAPRQDYWVTDGSVYTTLATNGILYLGGDFRMIGPSGGGGVAVDRITGQVDKQFPRIDGGVNTVISDGRGGLYVAGFFRLVGDVARTNLVHLLPDKTVDPSFAPNPQGEIWSLALSENTLYVGGSFTNIAGVLRTNLAGLDPIFGTALAWAPQANGTVRCMVLAEGVVVVGGDFTQIGGATRTGIAALLASSGAATGWNPSADGSVFAMLQLGNVLYVGGQFNSIGFAARSRIAALDIYTGFATVWQPTADGDVMALAATCDTIYAGGRFRNIGGLARNYAAALEPVFGLAKSWDAHIPAVVSLETYVTAILPRDDTLYVAGHFPSLGNGASVGLAAVSAATGQVLDWRAGAGGTFRALQLSGNQIYAGGPSVISGGVARNFLGALDQRTGKALAWNPNADGVVASLAVTSNRIYVGGFFTHVGGQARVGLAATDTNGTVLSFNPQGNGSVLSIAANEAVVYVGGSFTSMGGFSRANIAALDPVTGAAYSGWDPGAGSTVFALALTGNSLYAGGDFTSISGTTRYGIAGLNATTGQALPWNAFANNTVRTLVVSSNTVYFGGVFTSVFDQFLFTYPRSGLAAVDLSGQVLAWNPGANAPVNSLAVSGSRVYAAGEFSSIAGQSRLFAAGLDAQTGAATPWNPGASYAALSIYADSNRIFLGGGFTTLGTMHRGGLAAFPPASSPIILSQPRDRAIPVGQSTSLDVTATGLAPLNYQWRFNGTNIAGATNASLPLPSVQPSTSGSYDVVVANSIETIYSEPAIVTAYSSPIISSQSGGQTVSVGATVTLVTSASGDPAPRYQWRLNGVILPGANNSSLVLTNMQATNSGVYSVVAGNIGGAVSSTGMPVTVSIPSLGLADNFAARPHLNAASGSGSGNSSTATRETNEPQHAGKPGGRSMWMAWTAPANGIVTFDTRGSSFDTLLAVYTGTTLGTLQEVTSDDDRGGFETSLVAFNAVAGTEYQIAIDGLNSVAGPLVLSWNLDTAISGLPRIITQPVAQTVSVGQNAAFSVSASGSPTSYQWYFNCLPIYGATNSSLTVSNVQPWKVGRYTVIAANGSGGVESLSAYLEIGADLQSVSSDKLEDLFSAAGGSASMASFGHRSLDFITVTAGIIGQQNFNNLGATTELGEPIHGDALGGASRWFGLTPASDGLLTIDTIGSDFDTILAVYTGTNIFTLNLVTNDNNGAPDGVRSLVRFSARGTTNYLVAVDGVNGAQGSIILNWLLVGLPSITSAPMNQTNALGGSATLSVVATSTDPLTYQWRFNGVDISGATNSIYTRTNLQAKDGGTYSAVVRNSAGAVTNSALLTVSIPYLAANSLRSTNGNFEFLFGGQTGKSYRIETSSNLVQWSTWTNFLFNGPTQLFRDPILFPARYYRAKTN